MQECLQQERVTKDAAAKRHEEQVETLQEQYKQMQETERKFASEKVEQENQRHEETMRVAKHEMEERCGSCRRRAKMKTRSAILRPWRPHRSI